MKLDQKQKIVAALREKFEAAKVVIVTDYKGLDVAQMNDLRRKLREAEVEYQVVKNTMLRRASLDTDVAQLVDTFKGPSAIALALRTPWRRPRS